MSENEKLPMLFSHFENEKLKCMGGPYLLGSHGNGSVQKYSASSGSLEGILY
jgi:hypothetical protein